MKNYTSIILFLLAATLARAQYVPNNGQTFQFMPQFNPAFTGVESFNDLKFSYRYQWSGFGSHSPKFVNLGYNTRLISPLDLAYNSPRLSDPRATNPENLPRSRRMIHGLGGNIFLSEIAILKSIGANINYSIHYPVGDKSRFSAGASLLIENRKMDVSQVTVRDSSDPFYNHLLGSSTAQTDLNLRLGVVLYAPDYYFGLTYFPVLYTVLEASALAMAQAFYRGSIQAGVSLPVNAEVTLKPSILALVQMDNSLIIDYHAKAFFKQNVWLGLTYRDIKSGVAILGWNFNEKLSASYSYEMSLGPFKQFNDGSHELVLSMHLNNFKKYAQYIW
jgi:type IX secretion system PorP/SprF family membrane protein